MTILAPWHWTMARELSPTIRANDLSADGEGMRCRDGVNSPLSKRTLTGKSRCFPNPSVRRDRGGGGLNETEKLALTATKGVATV